MATDGSMKRAFDYILKTVSDVNIFIRASGESMDKMTRDTSTSITRNELRYTISLLQQDDIQPIIGNAMRRIMENHILNSLIVTNDGLYDVDDITAPVILALLLEASRTLLYRSCNQVWQMMSGTSRDVEGGPSNPMFDPVLDRLPGEPDELFSTEEAVTFFRELVSSDRGTDTVDLADLLIGIWQYHWLVIQRSIREIAIVCNHTIPHDILESASANISSMTEVFLVTSHMEIFDQLVAEQANTVDSDVISASVDVYTRDTIHADLFKTSQSIIVVLAEYLKILADDGNLYLSIEKTDEDYFILDTLLGDANLSDAAVSRWLVERFLEPLQLQLRTWPLCLLFAREFRETMKAKMVIIQALRNRALPSALASAIVSTASDGEKWKTAVAKTTYSQRQSALHLLRLESPPRDPSGKNDRPYSIDVIQSALAIADEFALPPETRALGRAVAFFADAKEYSVRLRAVLYSIVDKETANSMEAKETNIPRVDEWTQAVFFGSSIQNRDRCAAQAALATKTGRVPSDLLARRLRSLIVNHIDLTSVIEEYHMMITENITRCAKELSAYLLTWQSASELQRTAARVISRCLSHSADVAREIMASDILWISQLMCATFPEADNACLTVLQQISTFVVNAPFHMRALLDRDPTAIVASVAQAERLASTELDHLADTGEATNKIPDSAQDNPWHGWSIFKSEPIIVPPPADPMTWSSTAKQQLEAAGIDPTSKLTSESRPLGNARYEAGCFAMPNTGLMSGMLQELMLRDPDMIHDQRVSLLAYLVLEPNWTTDRPLNDIQDRLRELIAATNIGQSSIGAFSVAQLSAKMNRSDWYSTFTFALAMSCLGPAVSSLLATCIGNRLVHMSDGYTPPTSVDDPYLTAGLRVLTSKYPHSVVPPNIHTRRARNNFGLLLAARSLQSLPRWQYENLRLDVVSYYANQHAFYVSPGCVSARFVFMNDDDKAVDDLRSAITYATPN